MRAAEAQLHHACRLLRTSEAKIEIGAKSTVQFPDRIEIECALRRHSATERAPAAQIAV